MGGRQLRRHHINARRTWCETRAGQRSKLHWSLWAQLKSRNRLRFGPVGRQSFIFACQLEMVNSAATELKPQPDNRLHQRTHLFVVATLYWEKGSAPVHLRNMSLVGAQVEGPSLPEPGTEVIVRRGSLEARGLIAWKVERKGGVAFSGAVEVADWMSRLASPQDQVDRIVGDYRDKRQTLSAAPPANCDHEENSVAAELAKLRSDLAQLGNSLSSDVIMVATHPEIQLIDISLQRIDRLIARL